MFLTRTFLFVNRFSKFLLHILRQTRCLIVPRKYFFYIWTVVKYLRKTIITHYETDFSIPSHTKPCCRPSTWSAVVNMILAILLLFEKWYDCWYTQMTRFWLQWFTNDSTALVASFESPPFKTTQIYYLIWNIMQLTLSTSWQIQRVSHSWEETCRF